MLERISIDVLPPMDPALIPTDNPEAPRYIMNKFKALQWILKAGGLLMLIADWLPDTLEDKKISYAEMVDLGERIARHFGIDVDKQGIEI